MNAVVNRAIEVLSAGGLILYPTDTVWGIGCDATNEAAVQKIFALKQRADSKSLIILLPDVKSVFNYVANPLPDLVGLLNTFDRPTTVIYPQAVGLAGNAIHSDGTVAIRVTADAFCKTLLKRYKKPIVSTSANVSGKPTPQVFTDIEEHIKKGVDYIAEYRQEETTIHAPSRIIRWLEDGSIVVIRP
ncbi:threonylcarbamoyl-AMP synthase [Taibaiella sp. KBW10]|uniref:L-threonylcarbamoyladenylate synthase n=1 Tax=Taibaiella sp. KBW10 TaxID=2153357 RepID=UPI000F5A9215|nr:L-threonylcarbamoyladenylate synthase [Taibaiella sp. KBW10]RQO32664.1 threonylcarbamoyl-AMP synthase [Taibaiella sp. KBW10]